MKKRTIMYVGPLWEGATSRQRMEGLTEMGHEVVPVDTEPPLQMERQSRLWQRVMRRVRGPVDLVGVNEQMVKTAGSQRFDVVWVDKGTCILPAVLRRVKDVTQCLFVHHNTDDIMHASHGFRNYLHALDIYDVHFTSNTFNIPEMYALGARQVLFAELGYDHELFRPVEVSDSDRGRLGSRVFFIGHWEPATEALLIALIHSGVPVKIAGYGWHKARDRKALRHSVLSGPIWGEDYVKTLCTGHIGLGIVSKWNRNLTAGRIFEIPACGTFLLAERNSTTQNLYVEGKEAEFFSSAEELVEKTRYYLDHATEREAIARAGHARCRNSKYSWKDRVEEMMIQVDRILESKER